MRLSIILGEKNQLIVSRKAEIIGLEGKIKENKELLT